MPLEHALTTYVESLRREFATGIAREHAYRPALKTLLEAAERGIIAVNDPKRIDVGAPDFALQRNEIPVGFVEAKDIDVNLDRLDKHSKEQLVGYRGALPNLIHTNYLHFRWYVNGELREDFSLGETRNGRLEINGERFADVAGMLHRFINTTTPTVDSPRELAEKMAKMARQITRLIERSFDDSDSLKGQMAAFEHTLIPSLTREAFADMYAQTLAYGLFAARVGHRGKAEDFTLRNAFWELPKTNPFLKRFFQEIAPELDDRVRWQAETLASLLAHADMDEILRDFGRRTRQEDPVVHFYETFLREYDPKLREQRGVYYTPEPVVSYIVRSVDVLLRERFGRALGLADKNTLVLDPATGTGTFLYFVIQHIYDALRDMGQTGAWSEYARTNLLPRLFGFELLMAPYAVAHMKLGIQLKDLSYDMASDQRLGVYLTNTLEEAVRQSEALLAGFISQEANEAAAIKREKPIMVVLGNPPYSGHSANRGEWIGGLVRDYYFVDGQPLGERNPKWLQDDYVKFIRFGQWRIDQTQSGVLAYVTNHGYLDNPTFRGMRQQLMSAFTDIYILNLHGSSRKREQTPDGGADENVFDIQQGVAIGIFVKDPEATVGLSPLPVTPVPSSALTPAPSPSGRGKTLARVHYADLWGRREDKYAALLNGDLSDTEWQELAPQAPFYLFVPQDADLREEYEQGWRINQVMERTLLGPNSHRDDFAIAFDYETASSRINDLANAALSDQVIRERYGIKDNRDWQLYKARQTDFSGVHPSHCLYRPFDFRFMLYGAYAFDYHRPEINDHLQLENIALITTRQTKDDFAILATDKPVGQHKIATPYDGSYVSPLYLYPDPDQPQMFAQNDWTPGKDGRTPNLSAAFVREMEAKLGMGFVSERLLTPQPADTQLRVPTGVGELETFTPEDVFHYAYAVFHSPTYRTRYAEFLKIDFPRLPLTSDKVLFRTLCEYGAQLVDYHLMRGGHDIVVSLRTRFEGQGDNSVSSGYPKYTEPTNAAAGRVYINPQQYFEGIAPEIWEFQIGGYQVLEKWLKDRRGRTLSFEDVMHYQRIVVALAETDRIMDEIDGVIPSWPLA